MQNMRNWALRQVLQDWKKRGVQKARAMQPAESTSSTLRHIRQMACRKSGIADCGCWSRGELAIPLGQYPCRDCNEPGIAMREFSQALFGSGSDGNFKEERVMRRWMSPDAPAPMALNDYRRALANAWVHGWLTSHQAASMLQAALELEATSSALRRLLKRRSAKPVCEDAFHEAVDAELAASERELMVKANVGITRSAASVPEAGQSTITWFYATNSPREACSD
ncbi:TPA: hypothetical protein QDA96_006015 [Burkholderia vietnamiensis]|uniref:hypothetical protein n=1 Tax=Burkholderia vietnamiensis TaxID=60552 RepID=UPI000B184BD2|nr:hypothetical protein [Burkholderia vietnamiensis]MBR8015703.1 hypothetical protein [Burkholderia vietnamiensis]MCA8073462.1 hypothetical protein [Burkholderia vietnamiensis]HDR8990027.1 hypothetical protein [Burkholderia vietnamiensis]HDR9031965.1 hypothetical protein [Burkholderia vietnamiensis]HDR9045247.1 hypothetical protein [Burkholderia vietnamiensis]